MSLIDSPEISRIPSGYAAATADSFEPTVVQGMRAAGVVLLVSAGLSLIAAAVGGAAGGLSIVDIVLGVQLLRLRHSWKLWALIRAWGGVALLTLIVLANLSVLGLSAVPVLGATWASAAAIILFLTGVPTKQRIVMGWVSIALSVLVTIALGVMSALQETGADALG
jgi:hypothetical protein